MNSVPANDTFAGLPTVADTAEKDPELKIAASRPANFLQESNYGENEDKDSRSMNVLSIAIRSARNVGSLRAALSEAGIDTAGNLGTPRT